MNTCDTEHSRQGARQSESSALPLKIFVGKKYPVYMEKWKKGRKKNGLNMSWNWAGFFFSYLWLAYRKMYWVCAVFMTLAIAEPILALVIGYPERYSRILSIVIAASIGQAGNTIYLEIAKRKINNVMKNYPQKEWRAHLEKQGGTSKLAVAVCIGILCVYIGILLILDFLFS